MVCKVMDITTKLNPLALEIFWLTELFRRDSRNLSIDWTACVFVFGSPGVQSFIRRPAVLTEAIFVFLSLSGQIPGY